LVVLKDNILVLGPDLGLEGLVLGPAFGLEGLVLGPGLGYRLRSWSFPWP